MQGDGSRDDREKSPQQPDDAELSARLKRLESRLQGAQRASRETDAGELAGGGSSPVGHAIRYSAEFVGGPIVGACVGWALDKALGVSPWGMIGFLMLGFCAGIYNVMRSSGFIRSSRGLGGGDTANKS